MAGAAEESEELNLTREEMVKLVDENKIVIDDLSQQLEEKELAIQSRGKYFLNNFINTFMGVWILGYLIVTFYLILFLDAEISRLTATNRKLKAGSLQSLHCKDQLEIALSLS